MPIDLFELIGVVCHHGTLHQVQITSIDETRVFLNDLMHDDSIGALHLIYLRSQACLMDEVRIYPCCCFYVFDLTWMYCRCDDENVTVVDEKEVLAVEA